MVLAEVRMALTLNAMTSFFVLHERVCRERTCKTVNFYVQIASLSASLERVSKVVIEIYESSFLFNLFCNEFLSKIIKK